MSDIVVVETADAGRLGVLSAGQYGSTSRGWGGRGDWCSRVPRTGSRGVKVRHQFSSSSRAGAALPPAFCTWPDRAYATVMGHGLHKHDAPNAAGDDLRLEAGMPPPPLWAVKAAILAAVLVVAVPLLLLTLAALIVGALVLLVLVAAAVVVRRLRRLGAWLPGRSPRWRDEGRRNVRVIEREFHHS